MMPVLAVFSAFTVVLALAAGMAISPPPSPHGYKTAAPVTTTAASTTTTTEAATTTKTPTRKCYQCSYSPGKTVYVEKSVKKRVHDEESGKYITVHEKTMEPQTQIGGWDKCSGSFTKYDAASFGIDTWDCEFNCAVRIDKSGNLFRGCYGGEFGVDPENTEAIQQVGGSQYRFCKDDLCNRFDMEFVVE